MIKNLPKHAIACYCNLVTKLEFQQRCSHLRCSFMFLSPVNPFTVYHLHSFNSEAKYRERPASCSHPRSFVRFSKSCEFVFTCGTMTQNVLMQLRYSISICGVCRCFSLHRSFFIRNPEPDWACCLPIFRLLLTISTPKYCLVFTWSNYPPHHKKILWLGGHLPNPTTRRSCGLLVKYSNPPRENLVVLWWNVPPHHKYIPTRYKHCIMHLYYLFISLSNIHLGRW